MYQCKIENRKKKNSLLIFLWSESKITEKNEIKIAVIAVIGFKPSSNFSWLNIKTIRYESFWWVLRLLPVWYFICACRVIVTEFNSFWYQKLSQTDKKKVHVGYNLFFAKYWNVWLNWKKLVGSYLQLLSQGTVLKMWQGFWVIPLSVTHDERSWLIHVNLRLC